MIMLLSKRLFFTLITPLVAFILPAHCVQSMIQQSKHQMSDMDHPDSINFMIAYTLWYPTEEGLAVSYDTTFKIFINDSENETATVAYPQVDPRSGFKLGACYLFDNNYCDISLSYTWFYNKDNMYSPTVAPPNLSSNATRTNSVYATWQIESMNNKFVMGFQSSVWDNCFNRFDLTIGRNFPAGKYLSLHCSAGLICAWDEQTLKLSYGKLNDSNAGMVVEWSNTQSWYAIGPYVGLSPFFTLWMSDDFEHTFSICGSSGFALGWSEANSRMQRSMGSDTMSLMPDNEYREISNYVSPMIDICLGLCWESFLDAQWSLKGSAGWDLQVWFDHNQMFSIEQYPPSGGSYSMQGLTLAFGVGI